MSVLKVLPRFIPDNSDQFFFTSKELNSWARTKYTDTFGFYQNLFNVYHYMQLTHDNEFNVYSPKGHPLMWKPYTACAYTPTGHLTIAKDTVTACKAYTKVKWCHDEWFNSAFEQLIMYDSDVGLDSEGQRIFQGLVDELLANFALSTRLLLTLGQVYQAGAYTFEDDTPTEIQDIFAQTTSTCRGWVKLFIDLASAGFPWLDLDGILPDDEVTDCEFTGDALQVYDDLKCNAPKPLVSLINRGGVISDSAGRPFVPMFVVSDSIYNQVVTKYNALVNTTATNGMRITQRTFGAADSPTPAVVYYIDGVIPVVPLSDISGYDEYVAGRMHFAGIIASGNVQLGTSFRSLPTDIENNDMGMLIEHDTRVSSDTHGTYHFLSHSLFATALADPNYAVASIVHAIPVIVEP